MRRLRTLCGGVSCPSPGCPCNLGHDDAAAVLPTAKPDALTGGGVKTREPIDLVTLLRGLAGIVPRPTPPQRQAIPGNPSLRAATPGAAAIRPRRRGLLDEG